MSLALTSKVLFGLMRPPYNIMTPCGVLFSMEGALHVSIDNNDATWSGHFKLQISIVRDCIKAGESSSSEQCVITTAEGDDVKD